MSGSSSSSHCSTAVLRVQFPGVGASTALEILQHELFVKKGLYKLSVVVFCSRTRFVLCYFVFIFSCGCASRQNPELKDTYLVW